jgi:hypothetical protein
LLFDLKPAKTVGPDTPAVVAICAIEVAAYPCSMKSRRAVSSTRTRLARACARRPLASYPRRACPVGGIGLL